MLNIKKTIDGYESVMNGKEECILLPLADYEKLLMKAQNPHEQKTNSLVKGSEQALACSEEFKDTSLEVLQKFRKLTLAHTMPELLKTGGIPKFLTIKQMPKFYGDAFPEAGIRHLIFHERTNGFCNCVTRIGRKVLIDTDAFNKWIVSNKQEPLLRKQYDWERRGVQKSKHIIDPKEFGAI